MPWPPPCASAAISCSAAVERAAFCCLKTARQGRRISCRRISCYNVVVTKLEQIQSTIEELSAEEFAKLREWLDGLDARIFDEKIAADAKSGKLDKFVDDARANLKAGRGEEF